MNTNFQPDEMKAFFRSGKTRPVAFRQHMLDKLAQAVEKRLDDIHRALHADLNKPAAEAFLSETGYVLHDIRATRRNLRRWMRPTRRRVPPGLHPAHARVVSEPKGVVLIIGPWNYPFQLMLSPLTAALAAGNCAVLKPSEYAPHTAAALREMIADTFDPDYVRVIEGGRETAATLLDQPFDHIFFTGGTTVGKQVMAAAARRLIPVTLELGGKSPAIVCSDTNLTVAARRIVRGKFMNAGQTCVAPDHVWVPRHLLAEFFQTLKKTIEEFYGPDPRQNPNYGRIVSNRHTERLKTLCPDCECSPNERYAAPTLIADPPLDSPIMQEEIFGPLLPVIPYDHDQQIIEWSRSQPIPLALYLFTNDLDKQDQLMLAIPSGGVCINDTLMHIIPDSLPFGGKGESGIGAYHGKAGFDEFSHARSILKRSIRFDLRATYPPIKTSIQTLKRAYRFFAG